MLDHRLRRGMSTDLSVTGKRAAARAKHCTKHKNIQDIEPSQRAGLANCSVTGTAPCPLLRVQEGRTQPQ